MKIAQISPLYESVPPKAYGGTERVVSYLTEELLRQGHQVTLFASGDSNTRAQLVCHTFEGLRLSEAIDPLAHHIVQLQEVMEKKDEYDLLHFHTDYLHFPTTVKNGNPPHLTTLHGRLDLPELQFIYQKFPFQPLVSISNAQRKPIAVANWLATIYHGLPENLYALGKGKGDYVAFIGRISREKRPDRAIEIARRAGLKIRMAAKIDKVDEDYFLSDIEPLLKQPHVEFIGEIAENQKGDFFGNAKALLFPIDWPEPFGMVVIEAMACGTPVIAFNHGSVAEILEDGKTGFLVNSLEDAVHALEKIDSLDRAVIRKTFERRFTAKTMAENYLRVYRQLIAQTNHLNNGFRPHRDPRLAG